MEPLVIPSPPPLREYQRTGRDFLAGRTRAMLADSMGLGKTPQALAAAKKLNLRRVVILCPLAVAPGWLREIRLWWPEMAQRSAIVRRRDEWPLDDDTTGVCIVPYTDLYHRFADRKTKTDPPSCDALIVDESHTLRSGYATKMGKGYHELQRHALRVWCLTGTPMPNGRPIELLPWLQNFGIVKGTQAIEAFKDRFCKRPNIFTPLGMDYLGAKDLDALQALLKDSGLFLQRQPADVPGELPNLQRFLLPLESTAPLPLEERHIRQAVAAPNSDLPAFEAMSSYRASLAVQKAEAVVSWLKSDAAPETAVVFVHHQDAGKLIATKLGCDFASGSDQPSKRQAKVDRFAAPYGPRFLIASMAACGTGMNGMQKRTSTAIFAEVSWETGTLDQAEGRIRRIGGQGSPWCVAYYCVIADAFEEAIARVVMAKRKNIQRAWGADERSTLSGKAGVSPTQPTGSGSPLAYMWRWNKNVVDGRVQWLPHCTLPKIGPHKSLPDTPPAHWSGEYVPVYHPDGSATRVRLVDCRIVSQRFHVWTAVKE